MVHEEHIRISTEFHLLLQNKSIIGVSLLWILKVHCIMSYLWKTELDIPGKIWAMMLWKLKSLRRMYGIISAFAAHEFISFWWLITGSLSKLKWLKLDRAVFNWVSKVISKLLWFMITSLSDWFKVLAPLFQPIRSETKTNRGSRVHIFPRFVSATCNYFEFWLVYRIVSVLSDWLK